MNSDLPAGEDRTDVKQQEAETGKGEKAMEAAPASGTEEPMLWCPVCSTRLMQHRCKLVCGKCGYYMSCADYY